MRILCVDDEENMLHTFKRTLGREFKLETAISAQNALQILQQQDEFAVIVSDYNMPETDGIEFLKQAKQLSPHSVQILITGNIDLNVSIKAINETAIYRYLPKPCSSDILRKVILDALEQYELITEKQRLSQALEQKNVELAASNAELCKANQLLAFELEMAKTIYGKLVCYSEHSIAGLTYRVLPKDTVGGDFLMSHCSHDGQINYFIMGDVTGHGLQSALSVLLIADNFATWCDAQPELTQLAQAINDKICAKLPRGLFCAAFLLKVDRRNNRLNVWHGGMPNAYFLDKQGKTVKTLRANNLPLGALADQTFDGTDSSHDLSEADALFLYSDGVTEQDNPQRIPFGEDRLLQTLAEVPNSCNRVDHVLSALNRHRQLQPQSDDISLFELQLN